MSLYNFLYNLQRKSYQSRKRILVGLVAVSFLFLATFWFFMFKNQVSQGTDPQVSPGSGEFSILDQKLPGPVAALAEGFKGLKSDIAQKIGEYKTKLDSGTGGNKRPVYELPVN